MESLFTNLDVLENWFKLNIINLEEYLKIKSNIVDVFRKQPEVDEEELPF